MSQVNEQNSNYIQEDEIDLRELWQTILKGKKIIVIVVGIVVTLTLIYALKLPNVYTSKAILIPTEQASGGMGGLGAMAAMAGISVGGGSMTPDIAFNALLNNYEFMRYFVKKNKIVDYYSDESVDENYVFAAGFRGVYDFFKSERDEDKEVKVDYELEAFNVIKRVKSAISISSDKKTALITVSYSDSDRAYPPQIINAFLKDASKYLVENNLRIINNKLGYFEKELMNIDGFELRQGISTIISKIIEEKIMMQSKRYYQCDLLTAPSESYIKDKSKPKRALILVVSFITSIILGIFLVFFLEFIRKEEQ